MPSKRLSFVAGIALGTCMPDASADPQTLESLQDQSAGLRARLEVLEMLKPTMATLMPDFAERFRVMHRAGDAEDWATEIRAARMPLASILIHLPGARSSRRPAVR